ncbi:hypothetical protein [Aquimarina celericrescens]|uniref:Viral A-type inclusion protein n=1 Tax=Aquimarina celericrescens TaxID=1964542 RepID=A0ABW5AXT4_9FLAO|nr:hypothetical protein [Aquimarina celericrescens]
MKPSFFYYVLIVLIVVSCNQLSEEEQKFDALMEEVISVHDEVMPKMGEISSLIKELEPKIDTTETGKSYAKAQQDLKDAYDFMMTWMSDFSEKFPHDEETDANEVSSQIKILKEEEIEVNKLRDQINSSIRNARELLEKS